MARHCQTSEYCGLKMKKFSRSWISSKKPNKQRKYRFQAPLHLRKAFVSTHLSKDLRTKYGRRSVVLRKGDKVKVLRGQFKKKEGKVERINRKKSKAYIAGVELVKKDGSKVLRPVDASNLMIMELNLDDKRRKEKLEIKQK